MTITEGYGHSHMGMCPYCGGMHSPDQCPMMMYPAGGMMPGMGMGGMMPGMGGHMGHGGMEEMMMHHHHLLEQVACQVAEIHHMVKEIHTRKAKG